MSITWTVSSSSLASRKIVYIFFKVNKRLDEWVVEEDLDTRKVQFPRRGDITQSSTGVTTPKKHQMHLLLGNATSRPSSPPTTPIHASSEVLNGSAVLQAALQKKINRKRKVVRFFCYF